MIKASKNIINETFSNGETIKLDETFYSITINGFKSVEELDEYYKLIQKLNAKILHKQE